MVQTYQGFFLTFRKGLRDAPAPLREKIQGWGVSSLEWGEISRDAITTVNFDFIALVVPKLLATANNGRIYEFLFQLSSSENSSVNCQIKNILDKLPTCPDLIRKFKDLLNFG